MGKNVSAPVKAAILLLFLLLIFTLTALDSGDSLKGFDLENPATVMMLKFSQAISALLIFIIPTIVFVLFTSEKKLGYLRLNRFNSILGVAALTLVFTAQPVINWMGEINNHLSLPEFLSALENWMRTKEDNLKELTKIFLQMDSLGDLLVNLAIVALLAAVGEELLFRGALQNTLAELFRNKHIAIWVTGILFSALHAQFYGFIPRMMLGVVLGYLYVWSGSLWLPIFFHFMNNGMAVLVAYLIGKGMVSDEAETVGAGDTPFYYVAMSLAVSLTILYFIYRNRLKSEV